MSPNPPAAPPGTAFTCGLCGEKFTHGGQVCGACPISKGCDLVKCPSCGYQFPRTSRLLDALARLWAGGRVPSVVGRASGRGARHAAGPPAANARPYGKTA